MMVEVTYIKLFIFHVIFLDSTGVDLQISNSLHSIIVWNQPVYLHLGSYRGVVMIFLLDDCVPWHLWVLGHWCFNRELMSRLQYYHHAHIISLRHWYHFGYDLHCYRNYDHRTIYLQSLLSSWTQSLMSFT